jgi:hypothetical protein
MLGTVLRASGSKAGVRAFLDATTWKPLTVYWKGVPRFRTSRKVSNVNGFNLNVSDATELDLAHQIRDAARFIKRHSTQCRKLQKLRIHVTLDFGVEAANDFGPQFFRFPHSLLNQLARYEVDLEVSYYGRAVE